MKFNCSQQELNKSLNMVSKAVTSKTTIPVLKGILLSADAEKNILKLTASDLDLSIEKTLPTEISESGKIVVPAKLFSDIIRKLPSGDLEIISDELNNITITSNASTFKIVGMAPDEFPAISHVEDNIIISINREIFKNMIRKTSFAASIDESKGIIVGILMEVRHNSLTMVSLDGFRMAVVRENISNEKELDIVISARILNEINKIISETDEETENIELLMDSQKAEIRFTDSIVVLRLLEGQFIRYADILPKESEIRVVVHRDSLIASIERASLLAKEGKNNLIRLSLTDGNLNIFSKSEAGNVKEEITVQKTGSDLEIGFNSKYVLDALKVIDDDQVVMLFNTSVTPCLITSMEDNKYDYLVLPVRIPGN